MTTYIALFRGVNVGGNRMLPMKDLRLLLEQTGCCDVQTYIQSGNAIFRSEMSDTAGFARKISTAIGKRFGFEPRVLVLTGADLERAAAANPYPEADAHPQSVHLFFLAEKPKAAALAALDALRTRRERYTLAGKVFYLHTPDGFGISKLGERAERALGVDATARNWRTVTTLLEMARKCAKRA